MYLSYVQQDLKYVKLVSRLNMQETRLLVKRVNMYSAICNMHNLMTSWPTPSCACDYLDPTQVLMVNKVALLLINSHLYDFLQMLPSYENNHLLHHLKLWCDRAS